MKITSPAFKEGRPIPEKYTCDGTDASPELDISQIPSNAKSMALIVDDPDAPGGTFVHWVMYDFKPTDKVKENAAPGTQGINDFKTQKYGGPCPPSGTHRYYFKIYALDAHLGLKSGISKKDLLKAMEGHVIAEAALMGTYSRE